MEILIKEGDGNSGLIYISQGDVENVPSRFYFGGKLKHYVINPLLIFTKLYLADVSTFKSNFDDTP